MAHTAALARHTSSALRQSVVNEINGRIESFEKPSMEQLEEWMATDTMETPDGCSIEPDGTCEHGWPSWVRAMGII